MAETLSNQGTDKVEATEQVNVTGRMTPILGLSPRDGLVLTLSGHGGIPLTLELKDSAGNLLPLDTQVTLEYDAPRLDKPQTVTETLGNIQTFRTLSVKEQQNEEYQDRTRISLKEGYQAVDIRDIDDLLISIDSSAQIDWANSRAYINKDHATVSSE